MEGMDRASSRHGPIRDDQMEQETWDVAHTAAPAHAEEWRQTEPFDPGHLSVPGDLTPGTPAGMHRPDVERRADLAIHLPPGKLPADRAAILEYLRDTGAPDEVIDTVRRLPGHREFGTIGEVARALGIPTEQGRADSDQ